MAITDCQCLLFFPGSQSHRAREHRHRGGERGRRPGGAGVGSHQEGRITGHARKGNVCFWVGFYYYLFAPPPILALSRSLGLSPLADAGEWSTVDLRHAHTTRTPDSPADWFEETGGLTEFLDHPSNALYERV